MVDQPSPLRLDFHLLDRQIIDRDGLMIGKVDDVELNDEFAVVALLVGQKALGQRIGGVLGRWLVAVADRLSPNPPATPIRIPYELVATVGPTIELTISKDQVPEPPMEVWLRTHLIERIPGGRREGE